MKVQSSVCYINITFSHFSHLFTLDPLFHTVCRGAPELPRGLLPPPGSFLRNLINHKVYCKLREFREFLGFLESHQKAIRKLLRNLTSKRFLRLVGETSEKVRESSRWFEKVGGSLRKLEEVGESSRKSSESHQKIRGSTQ